MSIVDKQILLYRGWFLFEFCLKTVSVWVKEISKTNVYTMKIDKYPLTIKNYSLGKQIVSYMKLCKNLSM